jgi:hypothetical protein
MHWFRHFERTLAKGDSKSPCMRALGCRCGRGCSTDRKSTGGTGILELGGSSISGVGNSKGKLRAALSRTARRSSGKSGLGSSRKSGKTPKSTKSFVKKNPSRSRGLTTSILNVGSGKVAGGKGRCARSSAAVLKRFEKSAMRIADGPQGFIINSRWKRSHADWGRLLVLAYTKGGRSAALACWVRKPEYAPPPKPDFSLRLMDEANRIKRLLDRHENQFDTLLRMRLGINFFKVPESVKTEWLHEFRSSLQPVVAALRTYERIEIALGDGLRESRLAVNFVADIDLPIINSQGKDSKTHKTDTTSDDDW